MQWILKPLFRSFSGGKWEEAFPELLSRPGKLQWETPGSPCDKGQPAITLVFPLCTWAPDKAPRIHLGGKQGFRGTFHPENPHSISQSKKCLTGCMVTWTRKLHSASLGTWICALKYWEQHLGWAVNIIKTRCLFIYFYVCLFMVTSRRHQTSFVNQNQNIFQSLKAFLPTPLCSRWPINNDKNKGTLWK